MLFILGYILALCSGLVLGLIGGGGAVLTIPILIYIFQIPVILATAYSLCIACLTSGFGFWRYRKQTQYIQGLFFAVPSLISVYIVRRYLLAMFPDPLLHWGHWSLPLDKALLLLMIFWICLAAYAMLKKTSIHTAHATHSHPIYLGIVGAVVGLISGLIGIGGGILIVPALTTLIRMDMKKAIATSLMIVTIQSLAGFIGDLQQSRAFDFNFLSGFLGCSLTGMLLGTLLSPYLSGLKLKQLFGWCLIGLACTMLYLEGSSLSQLAYF